MKKTFFGFLKVVFLLGIFVLLTGWNLLSIFWIETFHYLGSPFPYLLIFLLPPLLVGRLSGSSLKKSMLRGLLPLIAALVVYPAYVFSFSGGMRFVGWLYDLGVLILIFILASVLTIFLGRQLGKFHSLISKWGALVLSLLCAFLTFRQFFSSNYSNYYYLGEGLLGNIGINRNAEKESYAEALQTLCRYLDRKYPYFEYKEIDWDGAKKRAVMDLENVKNDTDFVLLIQALLDNILDGHLRMTSPSLRQRSQSSVSLGGRFINIDGRWIIAEVFPGSSAETSALKPGMELTHINHRPVAEVLAGMPRNPISAKKDIIRGELYGDRRRLSSLLYQPPGTILNLSFNGLDDRELVISLKYEPLPRAGQRSPSIQPNRLAGGIGYIKIRQFSVDPLSFVPAFDKALEKLWNTQGLIIDIRGNPGGAIVLSDQILGRLTDCRVNYGGALNRQGKFGQLYVVPRRPLYRKNVVLLIDERCASAADYFAYAASYLERVTLVGRPTAGVVSSPAQDMKMPGEITVYLVASGLADPARRYVVEWTGVQPDILVPYTLRALRSGQDRDLQTAVEFLQNSK